jgi:methionyl-tRNA formyltransferase
MGAVVMPSHYDLPPAGVDMDYLWDPAIRADLLVRLMKHLAEHGALPTPEPQQVEEGRSFYVVHPLSKHLARLGARPVGAGSNALDQ